MSQLSTYKLQTLDNCPCCNSIHCAEVRFETNQIFVGDFHSEKDAECREQFSRGIVISDDELNMLRKDGFLQVPGIWFADYRHAKEAFQIVKDLSKAAQLMRAKVERNHNQPSFFGHNSESD